MAEYKADIKAQLTRAGLIRGQPRALYTTLTGPPGAMAGAAGPSTSSTDPYTSSAVAGPSSLRGGRNDAFAGMYGYTDSSRYHSAHTTGPQGSQANMMSAMSGLGGASLTCFVRRPSP